MKPEHTTTLVAVGESLRKAQAEAAALRDEMEKGALDVDTTEIETFDHKVVAKLDDALESFNKIVEDHLLR